MKSRLYLKSLPMGLGPVLTLMAARSDPDCLPRTGVQLSKTLRVNSPLYKLRMRRRRLNRRKK